MSASQYGPTGGVADQYSNVAEAMPSGYDRLANDGTQYDVVDEPNIQYGGLDNSGNETQIQYSHGVYWWFMINKNNLLNNVLFLWEKEILTKWKQEKKFFFLKRHKFLKKIISYV